MQALAQQDIEQAQAQLSDLSTELKDLLLPSDEHDSSGALVEVKGGVGGSEGAVFAGDLVRMYSKLADRRAWKTTLVETNAFPMPKALGSGRQAYRQALLEIDGRGVYGMLKHESGVHRVQRIPVTETAGRIHTSTAGVIVGLTRSMCVAEPGDRSSRWWPRRQTRRSSST
jgi:peptide chain release factor 1